ncbi:MULTISPECIES: vancomycin high temperature exclusion protein [Chryseobacterium]|uniref:SanA protein n=1 Tax=Chryseobacterium geocarposphaerae TaxID=1416776 RepID=A0ABU1LHQ5_9FLAO|nr:MULTISPECIES: ElyC/SanA/YdcF family protein [Chryseobacterium]MDR6406273.1 SanA protein [Chryseobacterium geocarposphaerae]MDR6699706.1 SanA protein [Chryseobacterium ginsenosidimutans]
MKKNIKNLFKIFLLLIVAGIIFIAWANYSIQKNSDLYVSYNIADIPETKTALLLGTSKNLNSGVPNAYFYNRIQAAVDLYKSGKIKYIIVSGDNSTKDYNEPEDMLLTLTKYGIPQERIFLDHAGFRTLDSVVRAKEIFGQTKLIIISQKFHNERAVFLAKQNGIDAFGYNAKDVNKYAGFKTNMREYLAKAKAYWDLIFGVEPKFGGEKILIP